MDRLRRLYSGEKSRSRIAVELNAFDIDIAIMCRAPEFEEDEFTRSTSTSQSCPQSNNTPKSLLYRSEN
jgi:hypothetical protein